MRVVGLTFPPMGAIKLNRGDRGRRVRKGGDLNPREISLPKGERRKLNIEKCQMRNECNEQ